MPELLTGRALKWFIANHKFWETWVEFIQSFQEFFLPRGFMTKLADQVRQRKQRHGENFKDYMVDMQTLMRPLGMSQKETLARIRENSTPVEEQQQQKRTGPRAARLCPKPSTSLPQIRWSGPLVSGVQEPGDQFLLDLRENRCKDFGMLPQIGKRHATPASEGQPGFARCSPSKLMGNLKAEERQLCATVLIDGVEIKATVDTGATASFISEELPDRLEAAGEVLPTRREVRMADGRYEDVTSMIEVDIGLGERTVRIPRSTSCWKKDVSSRLEARTGEL
ncbi:GM23221 [Drosophila sechellia]|uniref:GM23221 n=1 Tax=Drosophila sechellia TaxID=7238 RepID=B4IMK5_DROSE|nr:GM23221 [Drosophila sechellia]